LVVILAVFCLTGLLPWQPAAAALLDTAPVDRAALIDRVAPASVPVMIVLDASGSMNTGDAPGPRIDAAKTAITDLIDTLPPDSRVGLQVYGTGTGSADADKSAGCTDISTLAPVARLNPAELKAQVGAVSASGYTPIGNALRAAADALPDEGPRSIVLVSDGEDTCAPPAPCDVARELKQQGVDLIVHTVGFKVDPTAREQLSCIATATGGTYSDAGDATALGDAVQLKVDYAINGYTPQGTPITGADQPSEQAPSLRPGQYIDTFDHGWAPGDTGGSASEGTTKYYTIDITSGVTPYISATLVPPTERLPSGFPLNFGVDLTLLTADQKTRCAFISGIGLASKDTQEPVTALLNGAVIDAPGQAAECKSDGVRILQVERIGEAWTDQQLPVELIVRREPPADASAVPPPATAGPALPVPVHGAATPINGGYSFNEAPELASGATYSDSLLTGENRYYRVPVQWGQRLSYLLTPAGRASPTLTGAAYANVEIINPVRDVVTPILLGKPWFSEQSESIEGSTSYPARYTNRETYDRNKYALDGDYYLHLKANISSLDGTSSQPFLLTVVVSGDVEVGPVYQPETTTGPVTSRAGSSASATVSPATTSAAPSSAGPTSSGVPTEVTTAQTADASAAGTGWILLIVGLLVAAVVVLVVVLRRNRSTGTPAGPPTS
jgi:Ca-activated chloride channel family protein